MKQLLFSKALLSAATLMVGTLVFTACSNDEFDGNTNPTYDGESVKTQFAINIPAAGKSTRLGQDIVQGQSNPTFRGMDNIRLVPFTSTSSLEGTTTLLYNPIVLGAIDALNETGKYKVYSDVDIPVGTQSFLFYGEAKTSADATEKTNGAIVPSFEEGWTIGETLNSLSFSLKPISNGNEQAQNALVAILNAVANVTGTDNDNTAWSASSGDLQNYYQQFISMKAGSANSIKLALQLLYNTMKSDNVADEDGLKAAICTAIEGHFDVTGNAAPNYELTYKTTEPSEASTYPNSYNLPDGAVQVEWYSGTFRYVTDVDYDVDPNNTMNVASLDEYVYPASLYYWVKTPIKTHTASLTTDGVYNSNDVWSNILTQYTEGVAVTTFTQSVALVNPIQYAVASLNLSAKFADIEIKDNGANWPNTTTPVGEKVVTIGSESFPLTGILIGGQNSVGWDFHKTGSEDVTIYDGSMDEAFVVKGTDLSTPMVYSLALETEGKDGGGEQVRFAIEMTNNSSEAFTGADGIVPVGGKFYLVGTLTSDAANTKVFEQDHKTVAKVTINSLKSAYNCIPDLRSPKLELGLSVDLEWQKGLEDEVTIQ